MTALGSSPVMPADLLPHARAAKGFMPEDEGALLQRWARERSRRSGRRDRHLLRQVGGLAGCGGPRGRRHRRSPSTTTGAPRRTRPGWEHHDAASSTPTSASWTRCRPSGAPFGRGPRGAGDRGRRPVTVGAWWRTPLGAALHRRRPRGRARPHRLPPLAALGEPSAGCSPSTTSSPTRPTAVARRTRTSTSPPSRAAPSPRSTRSGRCECYAVRRATPVTRSA